MLFTAIYSVIRSSYVLYPAKTKSSAVAGHADRTPVSDEKQM